MSGGRFGEQGHDVVREQAAQWFARLQAPDAGEHDRAGWQRWMDEDACHREAYARLQARWHEIGAWASEPAIATRLADIPRRPVVAKVSVRRRPRMRYWLSAAATLAALALFSTWWLQGNQPQVIEYATAIGESRSVVLEDGTRVDLDTDTRLRVAYSRRERVVDFEQGRAHFDVVRDGRPLRVQTGLGEIRVVGTVFEVDRHADALDVRLLEGRVDVVPVLAHGATAVVERLQPGDRVNIAGDGRLTRSVADTEEAPWRSGRLVFDDQSLAEAIVEFNRYSPAQMRLADPSLARIRVSGTFRSDDPSGFVEALHLLHGVSSAEDAQGGVVLSRQ